MSNTCIIEEAIAQCVLEIVHSMSFTWTALQTMVTQTNKQTLQSVMMAFHRYWTMTTWKSMWTSVRWLLWDIHTNVPMYLRKGIFYIWDDRNGAPHLQHSELHTGTLTLVLRTLSILVKTHPSCIRAKNTTVVKCHMHTYCFKNGPPSTTGTPWLVRH